MSETCSCSGAHDLIFACSGGADVGELADRAAREVARRGCGRMYCLAGIGGWVAGILDFDHHRMSDFGFLKGCTDPDSKTIDAVANQLINIRLESGRQIAEEPENPTEMP